MKLSPTWRRTLRYAWSLRLMALAMVLTGCEAVIQMMGTDWIPLPKWAVMLLVFVLIGGAFAARLVAQKAVDDD